MHSWVGSFNPFVAICCNKRYRDTIGSEGVAGQFASSMQVAESLVAATPDSPGRSAEVPLWPRRKGDCRMLTAARRQAETLQTAIANNSTKVAHRNSVGFSVSSCLYASAEGRLAE